MVQNVEEEERATEHGTIRTWADAISKIRKDAHTLDATAMLGRQNNVTEEGNVEEAW